MEMFFVLSDKFNISHIFTANKSVINFIANIKNILILKVFMNRNKIFDMILNKLSFLKTRLTDFTFVAFITPFFKNSRFVTSTQD